MAIHVYIYTHYIVILTLVIYSNYWYILYNIYIYISAWWYTYPSEKYEFVRDYEIPNWMESHKIHVPNHQPDIQLDRDIPQFREVGYILLHDYPMIIMIIPIILVTNTDSWSLSCQWTIYNIYIPAFIINYNHDICNIISPN